MLLVVTGSTVALWLALPMGSPGADLDKLERKMDHTRSKVGRKKGTERVLSSEIAGYTSRIRRLEGRIGSLRARQQALQGDLDRKQAELARIQERLRSERARLARLRARLAVVRRTLARRLVEMYKVDKPELIEVVLNANGVADLLERGEFLRRIADQDRSILLVVRDARRDAIRTERRLDVLERRQQEVTAIVLARRNEVAQVKGELIGTRVGYQQTRGDKSRALTKVRTERHELQEDLAAMEREESAIRARLMAATAGSGVAAGPVRKGSGRFIWPVNGAFTSPFGQRWGRLHAGIDIAAPEGTPIRAADSGRVVLLGWTGGYGNYTCIDHGGGTSTCYAHQSAYRTSMGANVSQGQVVGAVGNTGHSFGAHLHFEVRINGAPVDPMGYL